jgi:hypothetical protein
MLFALSGVAYGIFAVLYLILLVWLGLACLRNGHWIMFIIGIVLPIFWIIGALMPPSTAAREAAAAEQPPPEQ